MYELLWRKITVEQEVVFSQDILLLPSLWFCERPLLTERPDHPCPPFTAAPNAAAVAMKLPFSVPVQRNPNFVGRQALLKQLHDNFNLVTTSTDSLVGGQSKVAVLHGLGGAGKTQLSAAYAHLHRDAFDAVLWIDGSDEAHTLVSYQTTAQRFLDTTGGPAAPGDDHGQSSLLSRLAAGGLLSASGQVSADKDALPRIAQAVIDFLQSENERFTWLLVVDNVDNLDQYPLPSFLPQSPRGKIIITTRLTAVARFGVPLEVGQIEGESAVQILLNAARLRFPSPSGTSLLIATL